MGSGCYLRNKFGETLCNKLCSFVCRVGEEMMTPALKIWRNAVVTSQSASQLSMCLFMLYDCVAWEKSIMKVVSE